MPNGCVLRVCVDGLEGNPTGLSLRASGPLPEVAGLLGDTVGSGRPRPRRAPLLTRGGSNTGSRDTQVCWAERRKPGQSKQRNVIPDGAQSAGYSAGRELARADPPPSHPGAGGHEQAEGPQ